MDMVGKVGTNGLTKSTNTSRAFEHYARGRKGISRSLVQRSSSAKRQRVKAMGLLIAFAAVVSVVTVSAIVPADSVSVGPQLSGKVLARPPGFPFTVVGYCWDGVNGTPLAGVSVTVTNLNTGDHEVYVTLDDGYYAVDVSVNNPNFPADCKLGDIINVTAVLGTKAGWSEAEIVQFDVPFMLQDVTLTDIGVIPEFPMIVIPVLGMAALVAVVSVRRRRSEQ